MFKIWLTLFTFGYLVTALAQDGYNEIYEQDGIVRSEYDYVQYLWQKRFAEKQAKFLKQSRKTFKGDNALDPMPRILTQDDYELLKLGVEQRAAAIKYFLSDYYSGTKSYAKKQIIPDEVVKRIIARSGEAGYKNKVNPATISFFYGPDIIKDAQGQWRVIEDNMGFIGGIGDLPLAQEIILDAYPEINETLAPKKAMGFYKKLAKSFKQRAKEYDGKAIMYFVDDYSADNEDKRIAKIFSNLGIEVVTPNSKKKLKFKKEGVFLVSKDDKGNKVKEKVGFVFLNAEHAWVDPTHPAALQRLVIEEASSMLKEKDVKQKAKDKITQLFNSANDETYVPNLKKLKKILDKIDPVIDEDIADKNEGFLKAILENKVGTNYSPGVDFIGDKEFYVYIEKLIEFYLQQEPVIKNIQTSKFVLDDSGKVNEELMSEVFSSLSEYVIKKVDGRGGDSVWVGPKVQQSEVAFLQNTIRKNPDMFIVQKYTPLSYLNQNIVDLRVITDVSHKGILVTKTPWGRGLPMDGNGKVNLSDQGREITVLVAKKSPPKMNACRRFY